MSESPKKKKHDEVFDEDNMSDEEGGVRVDGIYIPPPPKPYCSVDNKGPRLIITKISNNFFKSYAEEQVLGPFHKCFNAIVGPNGSGKSNVIDSMLFVFGYRASKIRCKKISVLLHNSAKHRNVQTCSVSVHFAQIVDKEGDDYDIVPGSEFYVSRTAHKDNSSFYALNGKRTHFKEISTLLKQHGIDLNYNRFLILQGEVEQISMMAPKGTDQEPGMLEYLEDIIGTTRYKVPLALLFERLEQLSELRSEKLNRLKLVENELNQLQGPMEEAVQFLQLENKIVTKKNLIFQMHINELETNNEELIAKAADAEKDVNEVSEEIKAIQESKMEVEKRLEEVSGKYENLEKRLENLNESYNKADKDDFNLQAEMTQLINKRKKMKGQVKEEIKNLEILKKIPKEAPLEIIESEKVEKEMLAKKEAAEENKIKVLASLKEETKDLLARKDKILLKLVDLNKSVYEAKALFTQAESDLKMYQRNHDNETGKLEQLRNQYNELETRIANYKQEIEELNKAIPERSRQLKQHNTENLELTNQITNIVGKIRTQRAQVEEVKSSMQSSRSRNRVLDFLIQKKNEGECPGLFGRLGDLGAIDSKYDVAISTACGPLDNIVVDSVDTAQWCIEHLKRHDVGRATIIALDKQEHLRRNCEKAIHTPENVPRLFDLIHIPDERVKTAFYYALRETLVADNLEQGSRIAYGAQRHRVVTLGGDLIETTGTMSGGGKKVSRGRMSQSVGVNVSAEEIRNMDNELEETEERLRQMRTQKGNIETSLNTLSVECNQMKTTLEKHKIELQSLNQQLPHVKAQLKQQETKASSIKLDPKEIKRLTNIVNTKKVTYEKSLESTADLDKEMNLITADIKHKMEGKVAVLDKQIKDYTKNAEKSKNEITRLRVALTSSDKKIKKSEEKIRNIEQDITNSETKLREMKAKREEIEVDAKKILEIIEEIKEKLVSGNKSFNSLKKEVAEMTKEENKKKADKIDKDEKYKVYKDKLNQVKLKIQQWKAKISQLKYQDIPNEDIPTLVTYSNEDLQNKQLQMVQRELSAYEEEFKTAKPNLNSIVEYRKKQTVYIDRSKEVEEVTEQRRKMREHHDGLVGRRKEEFLTGYNIIKMKLKEMYQMITMGGDADFEMLDTFDPFNEGIQFRVRPPKKTWKIISNLSGGEKTLSSLALVFALHYYKPSPLYVMDEIDAALDFKNVSIVGHYIKERTKNAQFIIISLRTNMFELTDYLIGIYKTYDCTKSICIDPRLMDNLEDEENIEADTHDNAVSGNGAASVNP